MKDVFFSGKSPFGLIDLSALQEGASQMPIEDMSGIDQSLTPQQLASGSAQQTQQQMSPGTHLAGFERYSRKVFVGGLPPDIDEGACACHRRHSFTKLTRIMQSCFCFTDEITTAFRRFGPLVVDWPHKAESKSYFPPKGLYLRHEIFILFFSGRSFRPHLHFYANIFMIISCFTLNFECSSEKCCEIVEIVRRRSSALGNFVLTRTVSTIFLYRVRSIFCIKKQFASVIRSLVSCGSRRSTYMYGTVHVHV